MSSDVERDELHYEIIYGDNMPSCTCPDYKRYHWPCKHMLAIFHYFPNDGWDSLPEAYKNCAVFNLDSLGTVRTIAQNDPNIALPSPADTETVEELSVPEISNVTRNDTAENSEEMSTNLEKLAIQSRDIIQSLVNFTYNCSDESVLRNFTATLNKVQKEFSLGNSSLRPLQKRYRQRKNYLYKKCGQYKRLCVPKRKPKKGRRVGVAADTKKKNVSVELDLNTGMYLLSEFEVIIQII